MCRPCGVIINDDKQSGGRPFDAVAVEVTAPLDVPRDTQFVALGDQPVLAILSGSQLAALFLN